MTTTATTFAEGLKYPLPHCSSSPRLISHGAEAHLWLTHHLLPEASRQCVLKYRPRKLYRHPTLDARLTRHRILSEARVLAKLKREAAISTHHGGSGVDVPALWAADWEAGWLMMEYIPGGTVAERFRQWRRDRGNKDSKMYEADVKRLLERIGGAVGSLHRAGVIHGDLTTGNMLIRATDVASGDGTDETITMIDFGLASQSVQDEDRAVDLYVLERALGSSHPGLEVWFDDVLLEGYTAGLLDSEKPKAAQSAEVKAVKKRLEDVRSRGRKRSMVG